MRQAILGVAAAAALAGCATQGPMGAFESGGARPMAIGAGALNTSPRNVQFATEIAGTETYLPPLPTAVVVLQRWAGDRNGAFCQAVMGSLPSAQQAEAESVVAPNLIRTRWLVQRAALSPLDAQDCTLLVQDYDFPRANQLLRAVRTDWGSLTGRGPYLLMIIPTRSGLRVAGLDGSGVAPEDFPRFIASWNKALTEAQQKFATGPDQPGLIRSVFDLIRAVLVTATGGTSGLITGVLLGFDRREESYLPHPRLI